MMNKKTPTNNTAEIPSTKTGGWIGIRLDKLQKGEKKEKKKLTWYASLAFGGLIQNIPSPIEFSSSSGSELDAWRIWAHDTAGKSRERPMQMLEGGRMRRRNIFFTAPFCDNAII
jgi:hypothetical protein